MDISDIVRKKVGGVEVVEFNEKRLTRMTKEQVEQNIKSLDFQIKDSTSAKEKLEDLLEKFE